MLRCVMFLVYAMWLILSPACAATQQDLPDFQACRDKELICYKYVAEIRTTQLASERERLFVERERALVTDWEAHREHRLHALWGQFIQTWILLMIGIIIVGTGLIMSWKHMASGLRDGVTLENAVEVGRDGFRMSSPVVGLFVFAASIWFFNIYIEKVYRLSLLPSELEKSAPVFSAKPAEKPAEKTIEEPPATVPAAAGEQIGGSTQPASAQSAP